MKLTLAAPDHAEHVAGFFRSLHDDDFPHPEMFSGPTIAQLLRDEELAVVVATSGGKILGCGLSFPRTWNQSLEIATLSVDDIPERNQVGKALFEALRRLGLRAYGVAYFRARTESAFRRGRKIGAMCWGFRPLPGSAHLGDSELIMGFIDDAAEKARVRPPDNLITQLPFAERIVTNLAAQASDVPYPKNYPIGEPRGTGSPVISGRVWPSYHSRGNFVSIESSAGRYPTEIIREFVGKVREKGVSDIRLILPVNQEQAFVDLVDFGFRAVAYLPGWFLRGPHRFDCVELVAGLPRIPIHAHDFIEKAVAKIANGLKPD